MADQLDAGDDEPNSGRPTSPPGTVTAGEGRLAGWRQRYRVASLALGGLGVLLGVVALVVDDGRSVLFALSGTGLFGAVLLYVLLPERFVTASVGRRTYAPLADVGRLFVATTGLSDRRVYLPAGDGHVRLVVPEADGVPDDRTERALGLRETDDARELVLPTTGDELLAEFREHHEEPLASDPGPLLDQLLDVVVEEFELVGHATGHVDSDTGRAVVAVERSYYGPPTTFDHPVAAFLAAGLAAGLDTGVVLDEPRRDEDGRYAITCTWTAR